MIIQVITFNLAGIAGISLHGINTAAIRTDHDTYMVCCPIHNADWVTVICCADINTAKGALDVAKEFNGDVQIELTGYWTWEQAQQWRDAGIQQVVYHRSRDAQAAGVAWGEADITAIKRLSDMGFKVTVTGGLALEDLPLFKGIPIHVFIAGRSIRDAASPVEAARQFKRSIAELWG